MGVDDPEEPASSGEPRSVPRARQERRRPGDPPHDALLGLRNRLIVGVVFFALYVLTFGTRGNLLAGLVGGALGGLVFYMLLQRADERRRRR